VNFVNAVALPAQSAQKRDPFALVRVLANATQTVWKLFAPALMVGKVLTAVAQRARTPVRMFTLERFALVEAVVNVGNVNVNKDLRASSVKK